MNPVPKPAKRKQSQPPRIAVYTRVSSDEQAAFGHSIETQRERCLRLCDEKFGENLYEPHFYVDEGLSRTLGLYDPEHPKKKHRPDLTRMVDDARAGKLDHIIVWRLDRLSGNRTLLPQLMEELFKKGRVGILSCTEALDFVSAAGKLGASVMNSINAYYCDWVGENVSAALAKIREAGYIQGPPPYGWRWDGEKVPGQHHGIVPNPEQAEIVRWLIEKYLNGASLAELAHELNTRGIESPRRGQRWSRTTTRKVIDQPAHFGRVRTVAGRFVPAQHAQHRFFDPEVHDRLRKRMDRMAERAEHRANGRPEYLLQGIIYCTHCGYLMNCQLNYRLQKRYYRCSTGASDRLTDECCRNSRPAEPIEQLVVEEIERIARERDLLARAARQTAQLAQEQRRELETAAKQVERNLAGLDERRRWAMEKLRDGTIDDEEFKLYREGFAEDRQAAKVRLAELQDELANLDDHSLDTEQIRQVLSDFQSLWDSMPPSERREVVQVLVDRVDMSEMPDRSGTKLVIHWSFGGTSEKTLPRTARRDRPKEGFEALTPRLKATLWLWGQERDKDRIARRRGVSWDAVHCGLWAARKKLGAATPDEAYEMVRRELQEELPYLPLDGRLHHEEGAFDSTQPDLTETQRDILQQRAKGLTPQQIADERGGSVNTVYVQLGRVRRRLAVANDEQAIRKALDLGLIQHPAAA